MRRTVDEFPYKNGDEVGARYGQLGDAERVRTANVQRPPESDHPVRVDQGTGYVPHGEATSRGVGAGLRIGLAEGLRELVRDPRTELAEGDDGDEARDEPPDFLRIAFGPRNSQGLIRRRSLSHGEKVATR